MIIVGEKINASRPEIKDLIGRRDARALVELAKRQAHAGAAYIDVNVGTGSGSQEDEIADMDWAVRAVAAEVESPLCIDSADPQVLEAGLSLCGGSGYLRFESGTTESRTGRTWDNARYGRLQGSAGRQGD